MQKPADEDPRLGDTTQTREIENLKKRKEVSKNMTTNLRGVELLRNPSVNKATAYTEAEKESLGLVGLVPDVTESIETQLSRVQW